MKYSQAVSSLTYQDESGLEKLSRLIGPTVSENSIPLRYADFETLSQALDYAARGQTGYNFFDRRGNVYRTLSYSELRNEAIELASRLLYIGVPRGSRMAIVANTHPDFIRFFFACQYAGLVPVPLPIVMHFNNKQSYIAQLRRLMKLSDTRLAVATSEYIEPLKEAAKDSNVVFVAPPDEYDQLPMSDFPPRPLDSSELAYLQFTSGSTRFPKGVMVTQKAVMNNLHVICKYGIGCRPGDRAISWLPFYHDMGLVGLVLATLGSQLSVDFFSTMDFVMRPGLWLKLLSENQGTVSFSPPFGYELVVMRLRNNDLKKYDLSHWRVAGIGAEMIRPEVMKRFATHLKCCGFDPRAFTPCYGMAECSLAVSFSEIGTGIKIDRVDQELLAEENKIRFIDQGPTDNTKVKEFVRCGRLLPGFEAEIRDDSGNVLPEGKCGTLFLRGPSIMSGYFNDSSATREVLSPDGWLNTGDIAYMSGNELVITGRSKDIIIINGRNIWPQDLEYLAETMDIVRSGDACAFSVTDSKGAERAVLVIQLRRQVQDKQSIIDHLKGLIAKELGIDCHVEIVPKNTLVRTTSGKPSRNGTKKICLQQKLLDLDF